MSLYTLKGFVRIKPLINNSNGVISSLGELSTYAMTFTKELGEYHSVNHPNLTLVSFSSKSLNSGSVSVAPNYVEHVLAVINNIYDFAKSFTGNIQKLDILNNVINTFGNLTQNIEAGNIISAPGVSLPEWISWSNPSLGPNKFKIWLSDSSFVRTYDEYSVTVVPPVTNLDVLFQDSGKIISALAENNPTVIMDRIQSIKNRHPETVIRAETIEFTSFNIGNFASKLSWYVIINGVAGDNTDVIRNEIITYCLNNSSFDTNSWKQVMPDLFRATEFILVPNWLNYAIPNRTIQAGIYSPVSNVFSTLAEFKNKITFVPGSHVDNHLQVFVHPYRSISISSIGNVDNRNQLFKITDYFKDFATIGTTSQDFNRLTKETQDWSYEIQELLIIAENLAEYSELPSNVRKVVRSGLVFVTKSINNIQYLIFAKSNLI